MWRWQLKTWSWYCCWGWWWEIVYCLLRLLLLLMLVMRIVLATVCCRFGSWGLLIELYFCWDFEHFGQNFEVEVQARFLSWSVVSILPLMFCRYIEKVWCFLAQVKIVPKFSFPKEESPLLQSPRGSPWKHHYFSQPVLATFLLRSKKFSLIMICFNSISERTLESHTKPVACPRAATVCRWGEVNHYFIFLCFLEVEIYMIISYNFLILRKYW